ncbi:helix-turn-helix transcriptional regulator [Sphingomonas sp. AP4-R1]|uniref:winged helix-turn-helix transcriptional regulator n=1 Tax=Sphingomonas sp. AP4-R1 TaxID=2735134 RepID=UPI00149362B8|nr:helix-turn-helix domain-containing protein [Sphingomonas sp. AP4-R1]QJU57162.1 helix-turn-helix transcriptional regulator [Sphingomonas sp. AP4-R1]
MKEKRTDHLARQLARGEVFDANCRSREVLMHLTGKWNVLLLIALRDGTMRFAELRRKVGGVSERMLARSLQQLEGHRLLVRKSYPVVPPHVEYTLTTLGMEAADRMAGLTDWIEENVHALIQE